MFEIKPFNGVHVWQNILKDIPYKELLEITPKESTKIGKIEIKPRPYVLPKIYSGILEKLHNFSVREDDVWITTFPKSGTTWMQEMSWLILNDYDFDAAKQTDLEIRSPFFEYNTMFPIEYIDTLELLEKLRTPRLIKTHLPIGLLPTELWTKNPKIIHVVRDPRDAILSHYHMLLGKGLNIGTLEEFLKAFVSDSVNSLWTYILDFWKLRNNPNYLFITFEEMKENLESVIRRTCSFLNKPITEKQMTKMLEHLTFKNMKGNSTVNHNLEFKNTASFLNLKPNDFQFMRKGQIGSHKTEFPPEFADIFNEWVRENTKDSDFHLY